jgi:hypothetical protein
MAKSGLLTDMVEAILAVVGVYRTGLFNLSWWSFWLIEIPLDLCDVAVGTLWGLAFERGLSSAGYLLELVGIVIVRDFPLIGRDLFDFF